MKITFLNVGQGDSIIIEWTVDGQSKIGIIDCNKFNGKTPTVEYIQQIQCKEIEFVILSHPHFDHYSGLLDLFEYSNKTNITIKYFLHSCVTTLQNIIVDSFNSVLDAKLFSEIMTLAYSLTDSGKINEMSFVNNMTGDVDLSNEIKLKFHQPNNKQYRKFNSTAFSGRIGLAYKNNPAFNSLSTVLEIYTSEWFVLLTSDADENIFQELNDNNKKFNGKFHFGQIPHHGSKGNFHRDFWRISSRTLGCKNAVISFGYKNKFEHPSNNVITTLKRYGYQIHATNAIDTTPIISSSKLQALDLISVRLDTPKTIPDIGKNILIEIDHPEVAISSIEL